MINPLKEPNPMDRIDSFPEPNDYCDWMGKIAEFIGSKGGSLAFGVENYKGDLEFFSAGDNEEASILFLTKFAPHELVFFGMDWMIGISSYPEYEGSDALEYAVRLYGASSIVDKVSSEKPGGVS
jgi:hypothetical protein